MEIISALFAYSLAALFVGAEPSLNAPSVDEKNQLTVNLAEAWSLSIDGRAEGTVTLPLRRELRRKGKARLERRFQATAELIAAKPRLELGAFAGRQVVSLNGERVLGSGGKARGYPLAIDAPQLRAGENEIAIDIEFSDWHGGPKSYGTPRLGPATTRSHGIFFLKHRSSADGTSQPYAMYVPPTLKAGEAAPLIVVLHGYSGDETSYLYTSIFDYADRDRTVLAFPHARGKNLYFGKSEDDILDTVDDVKRYLSIDAARVHLMGASMGGAGALSAGYHYPQIFAASVNFMGDSLYTVQKPYIKWHFKTMEEAARYSALLYAENGVYHPHLWIHGRKDHVAPLAQAYWLEKRARELRRQLKVKFPVEFDYVPDYDHEERLMHDRWEKAFAFLKDKRVADPDRVYFAANSNGLRRDKAQKIRPGQWNRAYWLEFRVRNPGVEYSRIVAERNRKTGKFRVIRREGIEAVRMAK